MVGFSPHSGWAALVAVGGEPTRPQVLLRARIEMADERLPGSKQPYHEVEGRPLPEAARALERFFASACVLAHAGVREALAQLQRSGHAVAGAGILDSAGRKGGSLEATLASHALIHTADGDHFRDALAAAAERCGVSVARVRERDLLQQAQDTLGRPADRIRLDVQALGRTLGPPWGADQKNAALLAWLLLAGRQPMRRAGIHSRRG